MTHDLLGFSISPATMARAEEFRAAGIQKVEISLFSCRDSAAQALKAGGEVFDAVTAAGMDVWSVHLPTGPHWNIEELDEDERRLSVRNLISVARRCAGWGAKVLVVHGPIRPDMEASILQKHMDAARRSLDELSHAVHYLPVAVENLPRTPLGHSKHMLSLMDCCAGLCFDVNHLLLQSHEEFLRDMAPYVLTTHLSDYDAGGQYGERHWKPGEKGGIVPWKQVCSTLLDAGYRGPWMFETDLIEYSYTVQEVVDGFLAQSR